MANEVRDDVCIEKESQRLESTSSRRRNMFAGLLRWSLLRHRHGAAQLALPTTIVYGKLRDVIER